MQRLRIFVSLLALFVMPMGFGCGSTRPRNFRAMLHPEPIVRARAAGLNDSEPDHIAIPTLIQRLNDRDPVVRLTSHEALKERTGKDFGYIPWADDEERAKAQAQWQTWWEGSRVGAYKLPPDALGKKKRKP